MDLKHAFCIDTIHDFCICFEVREVHVVVTASASTLLLVASSGCRRATGTHPVSRALALLASLSDVGIWVVVAAVSTVITLRTLPALL
jgi:hypothetical protein